MRKLLSLFVVLLILDCLAIPLATAAQSPDEPVVQAILFRSPTCPACHQVVDELLSPMAGDYGNQLQIVGIDTSQSAGLKLYRATVERYQIPRERQGVPTLVIGDVVLVGGREIPEQFPTLVEDGLAAGGIGWPDIPGLAQIPSEAQMPIGSEGLQPIEDESPPPDPVGFALAWVVLVGMAVALGYAAWRVVAARQLLDQLLQSGHRTLVYAKTWAVPILDLVGLVIAAYLAYVEITHVEALCGPIGECNIVQTSSYALMLGIPIAVLGVLHYLAIGVLWIGQGYLIERWANLSTLGLLGLTLFGTVFSIYLTCLELFVVRAICSWCLGSAVTTTMLMLLVVVPITDSPSPKHVWH
jgi:uncharacterized membrane protein